MKEYLDTIYEYYPRDIYASDLKYPYTPENIRQWELIHGALNNEKDNDYFEDMTKTLAQYLNCSDQEDLSFRGGIFDLSRSSKLHLPNNQYNAEYPYCVVNVSIIAKFYCIYFTKFTGVPINTLERGNITEAQKSIVDIISRIIKSYYNDYKHFPMEFFEEEVPNVFSSKRPFEFATYFECLITNSPY